MGTTEQRSSQATESQREALLRQGYVHVKAGSVLPPQLIEDLRSWVGEVAAFPEAPGKWMMYFDRSEPDGRRLLNRVENFVDYQTGFRSLVEANVFENWIAALTGEAVVLFKDKINFKEPGADGFRPHQDAHVWEGLYPGLTRQFTVAVAVDEATPENGCLQFAPGCHDRGLFGTRLEEIPPELADALPWVLLPMDPGDVVLFDSYVPHQSSPNESSQHRRMLFLTYNPAKEGDYRSRYFADKRRSYPPDCERDPDRVYEYKI